MKIILLRDFLSNFFSQQKSFFIQISGFLWICDHEVWVPVFWINDAWSEFESLNFFEMKSDEDIILKADKNNLLKSNILFRFTLSYSFSRIPRIAYHLIPKKKLYLFCQKIKTQSHFLTIFTIVLRNSNFESNLWRCRIISVIFGLFFFLVKNDVHIFRIIDERFCLISNLSNISQII